MYHMCPWPFWLKPKFAPSKQIKCYACISSTCHGTRTDFIMIFKKMGGFLKKHKFQATNLRQFLKLDNAALNRSAVEPKSGLDGAKRSRIFTRLRQDGTKFGKDAINLSQCGAKSGRCGT